LQPIYPTLDLFSFTNGSSTFSGFSNKLKKLVLNVGNKSFFNTTYIREFCERVYHPTGILYEIEAKHSSKENPMEIEKTFTGSYRT